ncbi:MAG TPA: ribose 5-phosphate isomerase B [Candidatus Coprenecus stercoripullorum]|nr:ribose 5-phosphate isomerase B [Candidatus Coprenecus stercoripullorum]
MIGIASDHAGYEMKEQLKDFLLRSGYAVRDFGTDSPESMDYPDVAHPLAASIENGETEKGIALCGTGNGISMTLNKHSGIRAALCWNEEIASLARRHNDANVLALPARFITLEQAMAIVSVFLSTGFEGGRHLRRIQKIPCR